MPRTHAMLDLETLDTRSNAVVTAVGAVIFDPYGTGTTHSFYRTTNDWQMQQEHGCTIGGDTVAWWLGGSDSSPPQSARNALFVDSCSTAQMLTDFTEFLEGLDVEIWGNGSDFDNVILGNLYAKFGMQRPWSYSRNRCFRTIKEMSRSSRYVAPVRHGVHHNALDDAVYQAEVLQAIYKDKRL